MVYTQTKEDTDSKGNPIKIFELSTTQSTGRTSADDANLGNNPDLPKATIDGLYEEVRSFMGSTVEEGLNNPHTYDAYGIVVMLVGELDYFTDSNQRENKYYGYASTPKNGNYENKNYGFYISATYKSLGNANYDYNYKPRGDASTTYGNFRFDNVNFTLAESTVFDNQTGSSEWTLSHLGNIWDDKSYVEITARYNTTISGDTAASIFRPGDATYVVVNGGQFDGMQNQFATGIVTGKQLYWTIGRNAYINGAMHCGTTSSYEDNILDLYYNYDVKVLGGHIKEFYGGSNGSNSISLGKREITVLGNASGNTEYDPIIDSLYGGAAQARLFSDIYLTAKNCTNLVNVYGGGRDFSATTYGDIHISLENCKLSGNLYGGGQYANCEITEDTYIRYVRKASNSKEMVEEIRDLSTYLNGVLVDRIGLGGDVYIDVQGTSVNGNIFGSGMGQSQVINTKTQMVLSEIWMAESGVITKADNRFPPEAGDWSKPIDSYPSYNTETGRVLVYGYRDGGYTENSPRNMSYYTAHSYAFLSLATVENVNITVNGSVVGTNENNGNGNVYGGGSIAKVLGDTSITVTNSTIWGDVYGGGDGVTIPSKVKIYQPDSTVIGDPEYYVAPWYEGTVKSGGNSWNITWHTQSPNQSEKKYEEYQWSNDVNLLNSPYNGIDSVNKLLYSSNTQDLGSVEGNAKVTITDSTVKKDVYGGGNLGMVFGNTEVTINGASTNILGKVYGGGNGDAEKNQTDILGAVKGNSSLIISGGTVNEAYGGCNAADVTGNVTLNISGGNVSYAYGGNNIKGNIEGQIDVSLSENGHILNQIFGGGNKASYSGVPNLTISGGTVGDYDSGNDFENAVDGSAFGGGKEASVAGTNVAVTGGEIRSLFGGSFKAPIGSSTETDLKDININITKGKIKTLVGGNDQSGIVYGNININVGNESSANEDIIITNFFSGCNVVDYIYGKDYTPNINNIKNDPDFKGITVNLNKGKIYQVFGGGVMASATNTRVFVKDGEFNFIYGGGYLGDTDNTVTYVEGGCVNGDELVYGATTDPTYDQGGYIFGGGYEAYTENATVILSDNCYVQNSVFGGGNRANAGNTNVYVKNGEIGDSVYGGGYSGKVGYDYADNINNGVAYTEISAGKINGDVFGGGFKGESYATHIDIRQAEDGEMDIAGSVYGAGNAADVTTDTHTHILNGSLKNNIYGGGYDGNVKGTGYVDFLCGQIDGNVYGGGNKGEVGNTRVRVSDNIEAVKAENEVADKFACMEFLAPQSGVRSIEIKGNVFGGGEGASATVINSTDVIIDLIHDFEATETPISTETITSGEIKTAISANEDVYSIIGGSVYGGGDLGPVGSGKINALNNTATITTSGMSNVTIKNGYINGSVYGGGSGIPPAGVGYDTLMGAVFGQTNVNVWGGHIGGSIFGGGTQSRVFASGTQKASIVNIDQNKTAEGGKGKIAVEGSVFAGGQRGNSATMNASVPTTVGNVEVNIIGSETGASTIYFVHGGIYGGGNFCLVNGYKQINLIDFNTGEENGVKTFYSLQRADSVVMKNSAIVLLGAEDLVDENDTMGYSINRINSLKMTEGSTIKLDSIVKYLGSLESDIDTKRQFINKGNNGINRYTTDGGKHPDDMLTSSEIDAYRANDELKKNVVCVANGLYLEVIKSDNTYGPVKGLFTLQLLYAKPGEGGGFVYGNKLDSTGDFISETKTGYTYIAQPNLTEFESGKTYFTRIPGVGYAPVSETEPQHDVLYYTAELSDAYMNVVDNVGGMKKGVYTYYYWYIGGSLITYETIVNAYIGSEETQFSESKTIPGHEEKLYYTVFDIYGDELFAKTIDDNIYSLVQTKEGLVDRQIAVEVELAGKSIGFLTYKNGDWGLMRNYDNRVINGHQGIVTDAPKNKVIDYSFSVNDEDEIVFKVHKSRDVNTELLGMRFSMELNLYGEDWEIYAGGTGSLVFNTTINIKRLVPEQYIYMDNMRAYSGVTSSNDIHITGKSAFTAEYQTKYIPTAFPTESGDMVWALSSKSYRYYMDKLGNFMTLGKDDEVLNISSGINFTNDSSKYNSVYKDSMGGYHYKYHDVAENTDEIINLIEIHETPKSIIPKNTKITMVDLSGETAAYYYYICYEDTDFISLDDFMIMGTKKKIGDMDELPSYKKGYEDQRTARFTERLVFIFDSYNVDWTESVNYSSFTVHHAYENVDIMDYVQTDSKTLSYTRVAPITASFIVGRDEDGIDDSSWNVSLGKDRHYDLDTVDMNVDFLKDSYWINTHFLENVFSIKIELLDASGELKQMPSGMEFIYNGKTYNTVKDRYYSVIPVGAAGSHNIQIKNTLYSLKDIVGETAVFRATLYSATDADYYNLLSEYLSATVSYSILDNPIYAISVKPREDAQIISAGEVFTIDLKTSAEGVDAQTVYVKLLKKNGDTYTEIGWNKLFAGDVISSVQAGNKSYLWQTRETAEEGTYRIEFKYGDKTEYVNLIII